MTEDELREQRERRTDEIKLVMLQVIRREHPEISPDVTVEISPDAAIDLFSLGVLDASPEEWSKFIMELKMATPEPEENT